jgi:hypothetical protein
MTTLGYFITKILIGLFVFAAVRGIVLAFDLEGRIKRAYGLTISHRKIRGVALIVAAITGVLIIIGWEVFHIDDRLRLMTASPSEFSKSAYAVELRKFYAQGGELLRKRLPPGASNEVVLQYGRDVQAWSDQTTDWIKKHMGEPAAERFNETGTVPNMGYDSAISDVHNNIIRAAVVRRANLRAMIETNAWD